ncbi:MAG TPA: ribonuclease III [Gammaproteobacteria bacterium]|nr:ribonuclease III [Gammaproteobacteria bacterium]
MLTEQQRLQRCADKIGHQFRKVGLLRAALTHRSAGADNNERLEFLGDAVLNLFITQALFDRFPEKDEGHLTRRRAALVRREALARIARQLELGDLLKLGEGELKSGGGRRDSILANALEAVIGAVYLDAGFAACTNTLHRLYGTMIAEQDSDEIAKDPKTRLQEYLQARRMPLPIYRLKGMEGEAHQQTFVVECETAALSGAWQGRGGNRRAAEQAAAEQILSHLEA